MCRKSGVLLHITSLPSRYGRGCFSAQSYDFIRFLKRSGCSIWQVLPFGPVNYGQSPYSSFSTFAGNHYFIDLQEFLDESVVMAAFENAGDDVDDLQNIYDKLLFRIFKEKAHTFDTSKFYAKNKYWLDDYALFMAIKQVYGGVTLQQFEMRLKTRDAKALKNFYDEYKVWVDYHIFLQFVFDMQWSRIKNFSTENGIEIVGDIPFYVNLDSCDVWANRHLFFVDDACVPSCVGGVPPDSFTDEGQLWGNPVYNFKEMEKDGFAWFISRINHMKNYFDILRLDHFRGFSAYWEIDSKSKSAKTGVWKKGPGQKFFNKLKDESKIKLFVEDLGILDKEVFALKDKYKFAGIKIMQFAFCGDSKNFYLPHNFEKNCYAYLGNHDNNTTMGFLQSADNEVITKIKEYLWLDHHASHEQILDALIVKLFSSTADKTIVCMQDLHYQGSDKRMNVPGVAFGNWKYQAAHHEINDAVSSRLKRLNEIYGRVNN